MHDIIDSHVHLDLAAFDQDRDAVIARAAQAGIRQMVVPAVSAAGWPRLHALARSHPQTLYPAYGLHPMFMAEHAPGDVDALSSWLDTHEARAIGEIGLDFQADTTDHEQQRQVFRQQLQLAGERDLPVIVHARGAMEEVSLTLRRTAGARGVVHSFSGSEQQARQLWDIGFHLGIGGVVTYPRAQRLRRIVAQMPLQFLLLESDAPDQPGITHRGERNEPAHVVEVLQCIAELRQQPEAEIAAATSANARRLFGLE